MGRIFFTIILWLVLFIGYVGNIIKLLKCDFQASYKAEIIRTIGIFIPPMGCIVGYIPIEDKKQEIIITTKNK